MSAVLSLPAVLVVGYLLGRWRPWVRLGRWADLRTRDDGRWWLATGPRRFVVAAAHVLTHPRGSLYAWRHRNDPPPPRSPALTFDPDWAAKRRAETAEEGR